MRHRRSLITHIAIILMAILLISTVVVAVLSTRFASRSVREIAQAEMQEALGQAEELLRAYRRGEWTPEDLQAQVNPAFMPGQWYLRLLDEEGNLLAETEGAEEWFSQNAAQEQRLILVDELGREVVRSIAGIDIQNIDTQLVTQDGVPLGSIHIGRRMNVLENASTVFSQKVIILMLGLLLLLALFLLVLTRWVVMPAHRLARASQAMAAGDFDVRADEKVPGEMGYLSSVFNNMVGELRRTFDALAYEKSSMLLVLEGLSEGIVAIDEDGRIIHRNAMLRELLRPCGQELELRIFEELHACLSDGQDRDWKHWQDETCLEVLVSAIDGEGGARRGAVALLRDVSAQERLERTRHDYVANISHELRTPLATMRGLMEPMADGLVEDPEDQRRYYHIILAEILRLSRLVNDLLELSGLQSGRTGIEMESVEVGQLLFETQERFDQAYAEKGVAWRVDYPDEEWMVWANEDRLSQVLTVLADNALKYTEPGGSARLYTERHGEQIRFCLRDTGVGISPEHLPLLFDRFYQADRSHSDKGNGLGLSIAQEILGKMGLRLMVESRLGEGSLFSFDVPIEKKDSRQS